MKYPEKHILSELKEYHIKTTIPKSCDPKEDIFYVNRSNITKHFQIKDLDVSNHN